MKKIILLFAQIAISLHFMAQSVRPNRINLADQEAQAAPTTPSSNGMVDGQSESVQTARPKVKSSRINLADKDVKSTQPLFIQGASGDIPSQTNSKIKNKPPLTSAAVVETVVVVPPVSKRPVRINLADQESAPAQPAASQRISVDLPARSIQKSKSVVQAPVAPNAETVPVAVAPVVSRRPVRINLADQESAPTQPVAFQTNSVDLPARSTQKAKSVVKVPVAPVAETVPVAIAPAVSRRPVRINLADQESAPTQPLASQTNTVDLPARSTQKAKSVVKVPVAPVAETVPVAVAPVISKRPVRINLADQETAPTQPVASQRTSVDLPARSIQKAKSVVTAPVTPVLETSVVSKRPARTNVAESVTTLARPTVTNPKKVVVAAEPKIQKTVKQAPVERPKVMDLVSTPETPDHPVRLNLAEQETKVSTTSPLAKEGIRPRTQVTSSKSLVDDTIAPLVETASPLTLKLAEKAIRVNLADEAKVLPETNASSKAEVVSVSESVAPVAASPKKNTTQRVIKTINNRQYIVKTPVVRNEDSKILSVESNATPLIDEPASIAKSSNTNREEKTVPVLVRKKSKNNAIHQGISVVKKASDEKQIAKLVDSDAIPIDKARSIAAELDLKFGFNSKELLSEESDKVLPLSEILKENVDINLRIVGHTDNVGSLKANYIMGNKRALVVKHLFEEQGVSDKQLTTTSRAYLEPLVPNILVKDMAKNRRVEVKVLKPGTLSIESKVDVASEKPVLKQTENSSMTVNGRIYNEFIATVEMEEGSRLTLVSKKYYGVREFWVYIYEANKDLIANPNIIAKGTMIRVPKLPSNLIDVNNPSCLEKARALHDLYVK
jgi:outer membrane protein OmpA-like peptidoglycan-associated protein